MAFPTSPTDGQTYNNYVYNSSLDVWRKIQPASADHTHPGGDITSQVDDAYTLDGNLASTFLTTSHGGGSNNDVNTSGDTVIDNIYTDNSGHITSIGTRTLSISSGDTINIYDTLDITSTPGGTWTLPTISVSEVGIRYIQIYNGYQSSYTFTIKLPSSGTYSYTIIGSISENSASGGSNVYSENLSDHSGANLQVIYKRLS